MNVALAVIDFLTQLLLVARRRRPRALARDAGRQRRPRRGADVEGLLPRDPDRHDRLHRHRDDLEHGRGGQRRGDDDPGRDQPRARRRVRDLLHAARRRAQRAAGRRARRRRVPDAARPAARRRAASPATRSSASSSRSTSASSSARARSTSACSPRRSSSSPRTRASSASRGSSTRWASTARCPTGCASCTRRYGTPWIGILVFGGDRLPHADPGPGRLPRATCTRSARCCRSRSPTSRSSACGMIEPDHARPYRGPGNVRSAGASCRCSPSSALVGTGLAFLVVTVLHLDVAIAGVGWLMLRRRSSTSLYRRRQGLDLTTTTKVADAAARDRPRGRVRVGARRARRQQHSSDGAVATAVKLAARRRRGIHVLVTITVPASSPIDAEMPEQELAAQAIIEQAQLQGGRRVTGHVEKVRAGQAGRLIVNEAKRDARPGDRHAAARRAPAGRCSARRSRPCWPSARAA